MASVELPKLPADKEFEEYVAAYLQISGNFVERNLSERSATEVLELDIIDTFYPDALPKLRLVEVKSGNWGFPDIFKVFGWMTYLNIEAGAFVTKCRNEDFEFYQQKVAELNMHLTAITDFSNPKSQLKDLVVNIDQIHEDDVEIWRFSYWLERQLLKRLKAKKKCHPDQVRFSTLDNYYFELNSGVFFTKNIIERLERLFDAFQKHPNISAKCGNEIEGNSFYDDIHQLSKKVFDRSFYDCEYTDIQISSFIEHRARLAILKNGVDYTLFQRAQKGDRIQKRINTLGVDWEFSLSDLLPQKFVKGLNNISTHKYFYRYPVFWQWFMWAFGGIILLDYFYLGRLVFLFFEKKFIIFGYDRQTTEKILRFFTLNQE